MDLFDDDEGNPCAASECVRRTAIVSNTTLALVVGLLFLLVSPLTIYPGLHKALQTPLPGVVPSAARIEDSAPVSQDAAAPATATAAATVAAATAAPAAPPAPAAAATTTAAASPPSDANSTASVSAASSTSNAQKAAGPSEEDSEKGARLPPAHGLKRPDRNKHTLGKNWEKFRLRPSRLRPHRFNRTSRLHTNFTGSEGFLCDTTGHALPRLQVLGVDVSGMSTLFVDVAASLSTARTCKGCTGSDFFDTIQTTPYFTMWLSCDRILPGTLVSDFSLHSFKWPFAAQAMHEEYDTLAKDVVLAIGLREPLKRMLAEFAQGPKATTIAASTPKRPGEPEPVAGKPGHWLFGAPKDFPLEDYCRRFFQDLDSRGDGWLSELWRDLSYQPIDQSLYGRKLRTWLDAGFKPSQFVIFPGALYLKDRENITGNPLLQALRNKLGNKNLLRPTHRSKVSALALTRGGLYPPVKKGLQDDRLRDRLVNEVFAPSNRLLVKLLSEGAQAGMTLVGYSGEATDMAAIEKWLNDNWDY